MIRLMMAQNDIAVANEGLREWTFTAEKRKITRQNGGRLYYGRMLMSHVIEALKVIKEIQNDPRLSAAVQQCDIKTRQSFAAVSENDGLQRTETPSE